MPNTSTLTFKLSSFMTGNRLQTKDLTSGMSVADVLQADNISPADVFLEITSGNGEARDRVTVNTVLQPDDYLQVHKKSNKSGLGKAVVHDIRVITLLKEIKSLIKEESESHRWLGVHDAAKYCALSPSTLRRNVEAKNLKASVNTGKMLFKTTELESWLNGK